MDEAKVLTGTERKRVRERKKGRDRARGSALLAVSRESVMELDGAAAEGKRMTVK